MQNSLDNAVVVGAAILDDAQHPTQMLAARRKAPKSLAGFWEFPGGKVEPNETYQAGLSREVSEELGVEIEIIEQIDAPSARGWPLDNGMDMHVYTAVITDGEPQPLIEHDRLEWVPLAGAALHALEWIPADRPIIDAILRQLAQASAQQRRT